MLDHAELGVEQIFATPPMHIVRVQYIAFDTSTKVRLRMSVHESLQ